MSFATPTDMFLMANMTFDAGIQAHVDAGMKHDVRRRPACMSLEACLHVTRLPSIARCLLSAAPPRPQPRLTPTGAQCPGHEQMMQAHKHRATGGRHTSCDWTRGRHQSCVPRGSVSLAHQEAAGVPAVCLLANQEAAGVPASWHTKRQLVCLPPECVSCTPRGSWCACLLSVSLAHQEAAGVPASWPTQVLCAKRQTHHSSRRRSVTSTGGV